MRKGAWVLGLFVLALTLSGCGGLGLPSTSLGPNPTLKGKVQDYAGSAGDLYAYDPSMDYVFGEGEIDDEGKFSLTLYDLAEKVPGALFPLRSNETDDGCRLTVDPEGVGWNMVGPITSPSGSIAYVDPKNHDRAAVLVYVDGAVRVQTSGCPFTWKLELKAGWNWTVTTDLGNGFFDWKTEPPVGFVWIGD